MRIRIATDVEQNVEPVWAAFTQELFEALAPPFPPVELQAFGGKAVGDKVHVVLNFLLFKQDWISEIVENATEADGTHYFTDEGTRLPFFLSHWRHKHSIKPREEGATIIDEIEYKTPLGWLGDVLFYPAMYGQFAYRKPIYRKRFKRAAGQ